jgi:tRNA 5-methylaminomethyl-2-thiouridine biosynthesis bifunctional protein
MTPLPIVPARISFTPDGTPFSSEFGDVYHSADGALGQARHVFLHGNGLPHRWAARPRFVILETGFGLGNNFLATWAAWRSDPQRCERLVFVSVEKHPPARADLLRVHAASPLHALAAQLADSWPPATPNLHALAFEQGRMELLLALGDVATLLPQLQVRIDAVFLDGFAPARNPGMWTPALFKRLARLAAPGCTAATWSTARAVRDGLAQAGFRVEAAAGFGHKREMTVAHFEPRHVAPPPAAWVQRDAPGEALIVGGGLAGSAAAWALARQGWACTVFDAAAPGPGARPPGGIFHGTFNAPDGVHAQWHRAAALHLRRAIGPALAGGTLPGAATGLLRLEPRLQDDQARDQWARVGLPEDYLCWMDRSTARQATGVPVPSGGWWYAGGGWVSPHALAMHWQADLAPQVRRVPGAPVARIERRGTQWVALSAAGHEWARAPVLVLACAAQAAALLAGLDLTLPLQASRGQTTCLPPAFPGLRPPVAPLAGNGYALPLPGGGVLVGATSQLDDTDPAPRQADHQHNLMQAAELGVIDAQAVPLLLADPGMLAAHVGWRTVTPDRLPLVGPLPDQAAWLRARAAGHRADALRHLPRLHDDTSGLYVFSGLGSRGLTHAALGARLLAAWIAGAPFPVEARLVDAVDPARFALRTSRLPAP